MPFGGVERPDRRIAWPPEGVEVMNVRGLTEALATAVVVRLPGGVSIDVACLPALALLKIWAWEDRRYTTPGKDASDLWMFLRHYAEAGNEDRLYDQETEGWPHSPLISKRQVPGYSARMRARSWLTVPSREARLRLSMRSYARRSILMAPSGWSHRCRLATATVRCPSSLRSMLVSLSSQFLDGCRPMLLTLTTRVPATDLGHLLHKNPAKLQTFELSFGNAHVFYTEATPEWCKQLSPRHGPRGARARAHDHRFE
jgi:hypothetical protein